MITPFPCPVPEARAVRLDMIRQVRDSPGRRTYNSGALGVESQFKSEMPKPQKTARAAISSSHGSASLNLDIFPTRQLLIWASRLGQSGDVASPADPVKLHW